MRRSSSIIAAALAIVWAQAALAGNPEQLNLAVSFDLDGVAADADYVVADTGVADNKDDYVVDANPDVCRPLTITVTDGDGSLTAGAVTVTGTDCLGEPLVATHTFDGSGTGAHSLVVVQGEASGPYFRTVTSVANDELTGEGAGDAIAVGFVEDCPTQYVAYGARESLRVRDAWVVGRTVNPFRAYEEARLVTTSGVASTTLTSSSNDAPFADLEPGDLLWFPTAADRRQLQVVAKRSDNEITVSDSVVVAAKGMGFEWRERFVSSDPADGLWIPVSGYRAVTFLVDQDAEESAGDTVASVECRAGAAEIQVDSDTLNGSSGVLSDIDLHRTRFEACRLGLRFGRGDHANDTGREPLNVTFAGTLR